MHRARGMVVHDQCNIVNTVDILWHVAERMRHILNASQGTFCGMLKTACFLGGGVI